MLIKFKNKMTMALQKMIDDGTRLGGLSSHIEVSPNEAADIFKEICTLIPAPTGYTITSKEGVGCRLLLTAKTQEADILLYLNNWKHGEWKVEYKKVPVVIVIPSPQTVHLHG